MKFGWRYLGRRYLTRLAAEKLSDGYADLKRYGIRWVVSPLVDTRTFGYNVTKIRVTVYGFSSLRVPELPTKCILKFFGFKLYSVGIAPTSYVFRMSDKFNLV